MFIAHGTADRLIPFTHGEKLANAANEPMGFFPMEGAGHNDPLPERFFTELKVFLAANE